jgi:spermidine/putrescine-binding protein
MRRLNRRSKLISQSIALSVGLIIGGSSFAGQFDGVTLRVATWGGSWKENMVTAIVPKFEALGGKIEFVTGSPQANLAKLIAARGSAPFDVMETLDAQEKDFFATKEFIQKIDLTQLTNKKYLDDWQYNDWRVASWSTQEVICYDTEKYKELGLPTPTTYQDLVNEKLTGRVVIPDITSGGGFANFGGIAYAAGGDEKNIGPGLELIKSLNSLKFWSRGGEVVTQFQSGDVYAAIVHAGWCLRARKAGASVDTVHPVITGTDHVGVGKYGWLVIPKHSKVPEAASWFINEYQEPDFQMLYAVKSGVVPTNRVSISRLATDPIFAEMLELDPAKIAKQLQIDYTKVDISDWMDQWNRTVSQ